MRSSILLSGKRDPDLIALYKSVGNSEFQNLIKAALRQIIGGGAIDVRRLPEGFTLQGKANEETIKINFVLTSEKDEDVRELLSHILPGRMGTFIKQTLRFYLGPVTILSGFLDEEFSGMLKANPVPVQVFSIGVPEKKKKQPTKRHSQTEKIPRRRKETSHIERTIVENVPPVYVPPTPQYFTEEPAAKPAQPEMIASTGNEEDDMLAMLEGLLG